MIVLSPFQKSPKAKVFGRLEKQTIVDKSQKNTVSEGHEGLPGKIWQNKENFPKNRANNGSELKS